MHKHSCEHAGPDHGDEDSDLEYGGDWETICPHGKQNAHVLCGVDGAADHKLSFVECIGGDPTPSGLWMQLTEFVLNSIELAGPVIASPALILLQKCFLHSIYGKARTLINPSNIFIIIR